LHSSREHLGPHNIMEIPYFTGDTPLGFTRTSLGEPVTRPDGQVVLLSSFLYPYDGTDRLSVGVGGFQAIYKTVEVTFIGDGNFQEGLMRLGRYQYFNPNAGKPGFRPFHEELRAFNNS
jgi:hypothetical protein